MKLKNVFLSLALAFCALAAGPARAAWSVAVDGASGTAKITDGNWTLVLYYSNVAQARVKYSDHAGGTGVLDLTTVNADLEAAGSSFRITEVDYQGFNSKSVLTEVYLPDYIKKLGQQSFMYCANLTKVCLSSEAVFVSTHTFSCCPNLETVYYNGVAPETGTVRIPASVTDIKNNVFENGGSYNNGNTNRKIKRIYAPGITAIKNNAFQSCAALEYVYAPNAKSIGEKSFQHCVALDTVVISPELNYVGPCAFDNTGLKTLYPDGTQNPEEGTVLMPTTLTTMNNYGHFMNVNHTARFTKFIARGMTDVPNRAFQNCSQLVSVEFSPNLEALRTNGSYSDNSPFYNCTSLVSISPSTWGPMTIGAGTFRSCSSLTNYLDLSRTGIETIPSMWAAYTALEGVTFPASLTEFSGDQHFRQMQKGAKFRFLGDRPTTTATGSSSSFYTTGKNNPSQRHVFIVDAATYPAWTNGTDFVAMSNINSNSDTSGAFSTSSLDFPTPDYPAETLGATIWGSGDGRYNWVVQYVDHTKVSVTWKNGAATFATTQVEVGHAPTAPAGTPARASTAEFDYTFLGWNVDPGAVAAQDLSSATILAETTFHAIYSAEKRSYTVTWRMDDGSLIGETTVEYGAAPTHAEPTKPATADYTYTFRGWTTNGTDVLDPLPAVTGPVTFSALFDQHDASTTAIVSWFDEDGTTPLDPATTSVVKGERPTHADPVKTPTVDTAWFFAGWVEIGGDGSTNLTAALPPVQNDIAYMAAYTSAVRKYTVSFKNWNGSEISSVNLDYQTAAATVAAAAPANPTRPATAQFSYSFTGWSPAFAAVTEDATYTAQYDAVPNTYTATFVNGETGATISTADFAYGSPVVAPDPPAVVGCSFVAWVPGLGAMPAANATYTATYETNRYTITWVNGVTGATIDTTQVEHGFTPTHANVSQPTTAKASYAFAGWSPAIEPATSNTTYTAMFQATVLKPMQLLYGGSTIGDGADNAAVAAALADTTGTEGFSAGVSALVRDHVHVIDAATGTAVFFSTNVTASFSALASGRGYDWTIVATQTVAAAGFDDVAVLHGRFYAKPRKNWFAPGQAVFANGVFQPNIPSAASQQVRLRATMTFPTVPSRAPADATGCVTGIDVFRANAGCPLAYYAWNGAKWVRLFGATAKLGQPVTLVGEIDFAIQGGTMTWYADGAQLTDEDGNWAIPMSLGPKQISRFVFDSETATIDSLSGDFDIGFNGTMILLF